MRIEDFFLVAGAAIFGGAFLVAVLLALCARASAVNGKLRERGDRAAMRRYVERRYDPSQWGGGAALLVGGFAICYFLARLSA